jgi:hypothetical protein
MITAALIGLGDKGQLLGREKPLPDQLLRRIPVFLLQKKGTELFFANYFSQERGIKERTGRS